MLSARGSIDPFTIYPRISFILLRNSNGFALAHRPQRLPTTIASFIRSNPGLIGCWPATKPTRQIFPKGLMHDSNAV